MEAPLTHVCARGKDRWHPECQDVRHFAMPIRILSASAACLCLCLCLFGPALAAPGGKLGTLLIGEYHCALPGDADGQAWVPLADRDFTIGNSSTYHTPIGSGTYLLTGKRVIFVRGPMNGMKFDRTGPGTLRWIDELGEYGRMRCVRTGTAR